MSSSALVTTPITQKPYFSMALLWFNLQLYRCLKIVLLADAELIKDVSEDLVCCDFAYDVG